MARINNDNQENINNLKNKVEAYRNLYNCPNYLLIFDDDDGDTETFELEEYDELQNRIQEIYDNPQDYTDYQKIYVEYNYDKCDIANDFLGIIKGGEE